MERTEHQPGSGASGGSTSAAGATTGSQGASGRPSNAAENLADDVRARAQQGKEAVNERVGQAHDKANELKASVADKLESGADALRQRTREGTRRVAAATAEAGTAATQRIEGYTDSVATRMERTAGWLRRGDISDSIVQQVQEHPARSLVIAVGVGYLLGRLLKD